MMPVDWVARLQEQGRFAKRMAREVPLALAEPDLTIADAEQLHETVGNCAQSFKAIVAEMRRGELDIAYTRAANAVSRIWSDLSTLSANKVRALQDPAPARAAGAA
jgi:hypothetical protein